MPSLGDMIELADAIRIKPIEIDELKCVAVRNRNSKCHRCADACFKDAVAVSNNEISIDADACVNCGACVDVCPTGALRAVNPPESETLAGAVRTSKSADGKITIACARKASKREGDTEKYTSVPCLAHVTENLLMMLASQDGVRAGENVGSRENANCITLVDGDCSSCKYGAVSPCIDATCEDARKLIASADSSLTLARTSAFPKDIIDTNEATKRGKSRRGLARQTGSYIKTIAGSVATKTLEDKLGAGGEKEPLSLGERLRAGKNGKMPTFQPTRNYQLIEDIEQLLAARDVALQGNQGRYDEHDNSDAICSPNSDDRPSDYIDSRKFGSVFIDPESCSGCGMCVLFCPTEALKYAEYDEPADENHRYIEFQASDCVRCNLCKDVCLRNCLEVEVGTPLSELLSFEPRLIEIPRPQRQAFLADIKNRFHRT